MKKRFLSLLMAMLLLASLAIPALAAGNDYVIDEFGVLTSGEIDDLNELAEQIADEYGVDVFFVMTYDKLDDFDVEDAFFRTSDYVVMIQNETSWNILVEGQLEDVIDDDTMEKLWDAYDRADTYIGGAEDYYAGVMQLLDSGEAEDEILRLIDEADLLSNSEEKALLEKLDETSRELKFDIIIVTMEDFGGGDVEEFTEDLYDMVYGADRDGVILLISMEERDWCISGNGEGKDIFTSAHNEAIAEAISDDLSDGEYADAFNEFVDQCVYYIDGERNGYPFDWTTSLLVAIGVGLVLAVIVTAIMKGKLKSVHMQRAAANYLKPGSLQIHYANEFYLYSNVTRTRRTDNSSSGSGRSGSHSTSSGKF